MKTKEQIENFLQSLETEVDVLEWVEIDRIDMNDPFESIYQMIYENKGFNMRLKSENAEKFLAENDTAEIKIMAIALAYGYSAKDLTAKSLADLLYTLKTLSKFLSMQDKINNFFKDWKAMKENIKDELKNKLSADFGRIAFSDREIENAIDLALNRCDNKGSIKKIVREAIEFLFA